MAGPITQTELYNTKSLYSLSGSAAAVWLFTTILALVFNVDTDKYKWIGLCVALAISFIGILRLRKMSLTYGTIAFFNGLLIYVTAVGIDSINQGVKRNGDVVQEALIPFTAGKPWWATTSVVDSIQYLRTRTIAVIDQKDSLAVNNASLYDSLSRLRGRIAALISEQTGNDDLVKCLAENATLKSEVARLESELESAAKPATPAAPPPDYVAVIKKVRSLNRRLLQYLNDYLDAGSEKPKTQLEALRNTNENINTLKIQIDEYNAKLDALIRSGN
jgi:hypothetical protein